ncbi:type IV secretion system protein VirB8 [Sphingomonas sp. BE270]|jgi:type IV secretion system protein VirB8|uniref:virB8 family protein n=1 Tax=unclassified Sphingomonas TaxID=196159 RepID=UPI00053E3C89|nr:MULTISPECIES: type IV secretion system protein [unclassified Sphingomonas]MDR7258484.1 type IV secretion system protein VirB8 [Sphingomonas sp. BE270]
MHQPNPQPAFARILQQRPENWGDDLIARAEAARRRALMLAGVAALIAVLEAVALAALAPLKTVVPYTILVDRQSGYAETIKGLAPGALTQDSAIAQAAIVQYVIARETFDASDLRANYEKTALWSDGPTRAAYRHLFQKGNPDSPLTRYPATTIVSTTVKSVTMPRTGSATVRFDTIRHDQGAAGGERRSWTAVIDYRFSGAPMRMEDRFVNPLGFQVTHYRRDAEDTAPSPVQFDSALGVPTR